MSVTTLKEAARSAATWRARGERVVLANGCFDMLHVGHVRYLEGARSLGDRLVVAINSDASVARLKGPGRPVLDEAARVALVAGLAAVDLAFVFVTDDVVPILETLSPDVHVKGTDYTRLTVPEASAAARLGIEVAIAGDPKDHSTRDLLLRLRGRPPA